MEIDKEPVLAQNSERSRSPEIFAPPPPRLRPMKTLHKEVHVNRILGQDAPLLLGEAISVEKPSRWALPFDPSETVVAGEGTKFQHDTGEQRMPRRANRLEKIVQVKNIPLTRIMRCLERCRRRIPDRKRLVKKNSTLPARTFRAAISSNITMASPTGRCGRSVIIVSISPIFRNATPPAISG
jgi:hypothetical protein